MFKQMKVGPELLSPSAESWLAYYLFVLLTLAIPGIGGYWLGQSGLDGESFWIIFMGLCILFLISLSMCALCHFMGHVFDEINELKAQKHRADPNS
jgi:hypothetical protein